MVEEKADETFKAARCQLEAVTSNKMPSFAARFGPWLPQAANRSANANNQASSNALTAATTSNVKSHSQSAVKLASVCRGRCIFALFGLIQQLLSPARLASVCIYISNKLFMKKKISAS